MQYKEETIFDNNNQLLLTPLQADQNESLRWNQLLNDVL